MTNPAHRSQINPPEFPLRAVGEAGEVGGVRAGLSGALLPSARTSYSKSNPVRSGSRRVRQALRPPVKLGSHQVC